MEDGLDVEIIKWLASENKLYSKEKVVHNYPHCWRCQTPLVYYAKPSWYIEMTKLKDKLIENNNGVKWFPSFVGEKRFGNWLENLNDWAISRTRYWELHFLYGDVNVVIQIQLVQELNQLKELQKM